jgi:hypothetical protein
MLGMSVRKMVALTVKTEIVALTVETEIVALIGKGG